MTRRTSTNLSAALFLSLACSVILNSSTGFRARDAIWSTLSAVTLLVFAVRMTAIYLPYCKGKAATILMIVLFIFAAAYEILALWQLYLAAYNGDVALGVVVAAVLAPTLYQRRMTPLVQTGNFLLLLVGLAMIWMLVSVAPQLRITNLSTAAGGIETLTQAGNYELALVPELLIAAMLPTDNTHDKTAGTTITKAVLLLCIGRAAVCVLLELFYGNAIMWRSDAFHTATASGTISMFKRMEWLQLLLWTLAVSVKVALFFYTAWGIKQKCSLQAVFTGEKTAVPTRSWFIMLLCVVGLVTVLKAVGFSVLQFWMTCSAWTVWLMITMGGFIRCTLSKRKNGA